MERKEGWRGMVRRLVLLAGAAVAGLSVTAEPAGAETLDVVRERGMLRCGVSDTRISASQREDGSWVGFEVDFCRAIAAAVLGDAERVELLTLNPQTRFQALLAGDIDVLFANATWTYSRDVAQAVDFAAVILYDGQGFIGRASDGARGLADVEDAVVCVMKGTTTEANLAEYIRRHAPSWRPLVLNTIQGRDEAFLRGRCTLQTDDYGSLVNLRASKPLHDLFLYPDIISKEPQSVSVRADDGRWLEIVRWTIHALVAAEELGLGRANAEAVARTAEDPALRPLLGREPGFGEPLGLADDWAFQAVRQVGNYGEIFDRNLGAGSPLKMERGLNRLWSEGGLIYTPPLR